MNTANYLWNIVKREVFKEVNNSFNELISTEIKNPPCRFAYAILIYLCTYNPNYMRARYPGIYAHVTSAISDWERCYKECHNGGNILEKILYDKVDELYRQLNDALNIATPCKLSTVIHGVYISADISISREMSNETGDPADYNNISLRLVGINHSKVIDEIRMIENWLSHKRFDQQFTITNEPGFAISYASTQRDIGDINVFNVGKKDDIPRSLVPNRGCLNRSQRVKSFNSIFFEGKDKFIDRIDNFIVKFDKIASTGVQKSYGIMMHGDPGTGKTTIAKAIALRYNMPLVKMTWGGIDVKELESSLSTVCASPAVILFDDCDSMISITDKNGNLAYRDLLLKTLDGVFCVGDSPVIFVLTTNFIEKIDSAIIRPGRIDLKIQLGNIHRDGINDMCKYFGIDDVNQLIDILKEKNPDAASKLSDIDVAGVNPAWLQSKIIDVI